MVSALVILFNFSKASYDEKVTALPSCRITDFRHFGNALTLPAIGSDEVVFKQRLTTYQQKFSTVTRNTFKDNWDKLTLGNLGESTLGDR
jgi:hypothetical protein